MLVYFMKSIALHLPDAFLNVHFSVIAPGKPVPIYHAIRHVLKSRRAICWCRKSLAGACQNALKLPVNWYADCDKPLQVGEA